MRVGQIDVLEEAREEEAGAIGKVGLLVFSRFVAADHIREFPETFGTDLHGMISLVRRV